MPAAWFRIDSDTYGGVLQLWAGATHPLSETVGLATDIYVNSGSLGEFDIGPAFTAGPFVVTPMVGVQFDWAQKRTAAIVPQLYVVGGPDPIYGELWVQNYLYKALGYNLDSYLYFRLFVDYKLGKYLALGPEVEPLFTLTGANKKLTSLPLGINALLTNYGANNSLIVFLGYELEKDNRLPSGDEPNKRGLVGRLTFIKNF